MEELTLNEIQKASLGVLLKFHEICEKHNLTYYLAYGTLIGAVRHGGFIPWDDDVDVWMPRDDFDRFKAICNEENMQPYKLCTRSNTKNYTYYIPRFANMEYKYVTTSKNVKDFDIGVFLDIYPLDNYPDEEKKEKLFKKIDKINRNYAIYVNGRSSSNVLKTFFKILIHFVLRLAHNNHYSSNVDNKIDKLIKANTISNDKLGMYAWESTVDGKYAYKKEYFNNKMLMKFEEYKFWVPKEYDEILKYYYGNYMELPPENERVPYHNYKIYKREDM